MNQKMKFFYFFNEILFQLQSHIINYRIHIFALYFNYHFENMMRKVFIGGNWKSNNTLCQTKQVVENVLDQLEFDPQAVDVVVAPIYLHLVTVQFTKKNANVKVAAQNCSKFPMGAYTGQITPDHIKDMNMQWVIIGHSERRTHFKQSNEDLKTKVQSAFKSQLKVIYCFGQTLEQREAKKTIQVVEQQLNAIKDVVKDWENIVLAYQPVWAIGTGKTATPEQVDEIHNWIREYLNKSAGEKSESVRIIYGGSVNQKNCDELIQLKNVDGFLVGGASLKPAFIDIIKSAKLKKK